MIALLSRIFLHKIQDEAAIRHGYGMICGAVGIFLNLILSCFKIVLGVLIGSLAIQADGFNNLGDDGSSLVSLGGFVLSNKKPDKEHPFGHGRAEYLSALVIAFFVWGCDPQDTLPVAQAGFPSSRFPPSPGPSRPSWTGRQRQRFLS